MKILAIPISYGLFRPISGGQNRFYNILKKLKKLDNSIVIAEEIDYKDYREEFCDKIYYYSNIFSAKLAIFRDFNLNFVFLIYRIIKTEDIDLIQITHPSGSFIVKILIMIKGKKIPIVYDAHNIESNFIEEVLKDNPNYSRLEKHLVTFFIRFLERLTCKYIFNHINTVSQKDKDVLIGKYGLNNEKITVIPSGCDIKPFESENNHVSIKELLNIDPKPLIIVFHGLYSYLPNKEAFDLIKDYISPQFKDREVLFLVGGTGSPKIRVDNFFSLGFIEDLDSFLSIADIAIVPLSKGAGTKIKLMDYLSYGIPIVTTIKGAEGLELVNNKHAVITEKVDEKFINAIIQLADDEKKRKSMSNNARRLAEELYSWDKIVNKLSESYKVLNKGQLL